ncbi:hypothetical protein [Roseovarius dicentrarchi]|uniref:hypothetical protein n=1 Tax=Roseovarius dicentrarchi TaxID=2250573 RepID=UPI000DE97931|nr:hypothetical protein [Roseovarius dicentrarchi]
MPKLIRLYITHVIIGFAIAGAFVGMLLWFDIANLWHLVSNSDKGWLAVLVLWLANGVVFAGVQFGIAVMNMKDDDDEPRGGHKQRVSRNHGQMVPVRVAAQARPETSKRR